METDPQIGSLDSMNSVHFFNLLDILHSPIYSFQFLDFLDYGNVFTFFMDRFSQISELRIPEGFRIHEIRKGLVH